MMKLYWVVRSEGPKIGPFDTERDAHICKEALAYHCDWQTWSVSATDTGESDE